MSIHRYELSRSDFDKFFKNLWISADLPHGLLLASGAPATLAGSRIRHSGWNLASLYFIITVLAEPVLVDWISAGFTTCFLLGHSKPPSPYYITPRNLRKTKN
jgi:hypothetical protein